ncbi:lysine--tRNA ligase [Mycobacterium sp. 1274761.0]|uniref:lysine--tRNA ligase n=1 Tax=Mycobacterium sp. 1274761.0 TaxID=1834077 RepID=UPI0008001AD0|nr:lysine--tRNA ligase [Mycobacterium sp. 1274761.0]OBK79024.1 lysine--tRNA ligase [Mycobacterium sp. 1274761.0]
MTSPEQPNNDAADIPEQFRIRQGKRERLLAEGREPYPVEVERTHTLAEIRAAYPDLPIDTATGEVVAVAGRVVFARNSGKLCFATLQEGDGTQLQAMISLAKVGQESLDRWKSDVDLGDIISVHGEVISSRRGELSVLADSWQIISKALRPLPVAHKEMSEESRVRQRYVDLIVRPEARTIARQRVAVVRAVRSALERRGFLEVETPMLQTLAGGAAARPFVTHSNALDADLYLRIAPELFLKRCLVGGLEKVFELNRVFRNEGADSTHSPEFAMLETYEAYGTYDDSAVMTRELIQEVADEAIGTRAVPLPDGTSYDLDGEWAAIQMYPSLSEALGEEVTPHTSVERLWEFADRLGVEIPRDRGYGHGKLVEELWEHTVGNSLSAPTFVRDFPVETTPLTRAHRSIPGVTEKWDLYVRGIELATGYSELIDPVIQRERFAAQARAAAAGDDEAMVLDEDFLTALEYGMPPTTGTGMGIDRLLMALTGLSIRETVLFPIVRRQTH